MSIKVIYESGASNQTTDITDYMRIGTFDVVENAEEGSVAMSEFTFDDPNGTLDIIGWRRLWAYESTATGSNSLIYHGWIAERTVSRGPYRNGAGRVWTVNAADQNVVLGFRALSWHAQRPQETDVARVNWLRSVSETFGRAPITEDEFFFQAGAVTMDGNVDYRGQSVLDVLNDCAQQSGKNYFCYTKDNGYPSSQPTRGLWYGSTEHTSYASPLRLTNVLADVDNVLTFAISLDQTSLERKADRVYSGAMVQYDGGTVYEQNVATYNYFTQRDAIVPAPNVKTAAGATRRAQRYLADLNTEEDRITTAVYLPAAKVNFIKPGMRVQFKASHLPGYSTSYVWGRVLQRRVAEVSEEEASTTPKYLVTLVIGSSPVSGECGSLALTQQSGVQYQNATNTLPSALSTCLQIWVEQHRVTPADAEPPPTPPGFTRAGWAYAIGDSNNGRVQISYRVTQAGDSNSVQSVNTSANRSHYLFEFGGIDSFTGVVTANDQPSQSPITSSSLTLGGSGKSLVIGAFIKSGHGAAGGNSNPDLGIVSPATQIGESGTLVTNDEGPTLVIGYRLIDPSGGSVSMSATGDNTGFATTGNWAYVVAAFNGS